MFGIAGGNITSIRNCIRLCMEFSAEAHLRKNNFAGTKFTTAKPTMRILHSHKTMLRINDSKKCIRKLTSSTSHEIAVAEKEKMAERVTSGVDSMCSSFSFSPSIFDEWVAVAGQ